MYKTVTTSEWPTRLKLAKVVSGLGQRTDPEQNTAGHLLRKLFHHDGRKENGRALAAF